MIYVISDIHGDLRRFNKMLRLIDFRDEDTLYVLGDMIDRGEFPITVLLKCLKTDNIIPLMGNHEEMMLEFITDSKYDNWLYNGGTVTYNQMCEMPKENIEHLIEKVKALEYNKTIRLFGKKYILVHAGVEIDSHGYVLVQQSKDYMTWARQEFYDYDNVVNDSQTVIFGHTPTKSLHGEFTIWYGENKIGIDCGAVYGGQLACLRLDDMKEFYV